MDYQELFNYMANNHDVNLLESEMQEVISIVKGMLNNDEAPIETPSVNDNEQKGKICNAPEDDGCYCKEVDMGCLQCKFYH